MTEASEWQRSTDNGGSQSSARSSSATDGALLSEAPEPDSSRTDGSATAGSVTGSSPGAGTGPSEAVLGPFTLRELVFGGGVLFVFLGTLLPYIDGVVGYNNFWNTASLFFIGLGILLPVTALALLAGRRLGTAGLRVGSLSVDQFASVTSVLAATFFFLQTVVSFHIGPFLSLLGAFAMLTATVLAPFLPVLKNDFIDRPEVPAHRVARPMTAARPRPEKPAAEAKAGSPAASSQKVSLPKVSAPKVRQSKGKGAVNPAAAGMRQNGAGLYGAGGAGAVGAGAAAAGQSGFASESTSTHDDSTEWRSESDSWDDGRVTENDGSGRTAGGSSAARGTSRSSDPREETTALQQPAPRADETRVNDAVREEGGSSEFARPKSSGTADGADRARQEPITATRAAEEETVVEAFWFAVGSARPVYDEQSDQEAFVLEPGDWEVGIEDRGDEFLVQDKRTGAVGILRDLSNIERAPRD